MALFITFEGIEGTGKSTQIKLLYDALVARKIAVVATREPGGTALGDELRKILLDPKNTNMVAACELLLYGASRAQHIHQVIKPALKAGKVVLCDRYLDATHAYQGLARGFSPDHIDQVNALAEAIQPDLTFLLDLEPQAGLARAKSRNHKTNTHEERFENEALEFHAKVRAGYLKIARKEKKRFVILDAGQNRDILRQKILQVVLKKIEV